MPITVADAETILSYEAGIKADLFNRRARVAFSVYDFDVKNQQLTVVGGNSNVNRLINAAKTKGRGAELDFEGYLTSDSRSAPAAATTSPKSATPACRSTSARNAP